MFSHFSCIVAPAIRASFVALAAPGKLIVVKLDAEPRLLRNADAALNDRHATSGNDLVFL